MSPSYKKIFSRNNDFQHAEVLIRNRQKRTSFGEILVEGVIPINRLLKSSWQISSLFFSNSAELSRWARDVIKASRAEHHFELPRNLLAELSDKEEPSEILAIVKVPDDDLKRIEVKKVPLILVFDRPSSPGNLGSSIRSADAFGVDGIIVTGHAADVYDPASVRASRGSIFGVPIVRLPSQNELLGWLASFRKHYPILQIVGSSLDSAAIASKHDFKLPTVLVMGNETFGMSKAYQELCTCSVTIPMYGTADSLNVSCATSILLYEVTRQRATDSKL